MATGARRQVAGAILVLVLTAPKAAAQYVPPPPPPNPAAAPAPGLRHFVVEPAITLRETYTDNAFIGTEPRRSDFVTEVTPSIRVEGRGPRLAGHLLYRPSALFYARNDEGNDVANQLDAYGTAEAIERFFFLEASANVSQNFATPFAPTPGDLALNTANRIETRTVSLSPYVRSQAIRGVEYEVRNRNTWTTTDNNDLGDVRTRQWTARVNRPVRVVGWGLEFDDTERRHDDAFGRPVQESTLDRGRLHYQLDPAWRVSASAGQEKNNFDPTQTGWQTIAGAGVAWRPTPRTTAEFEYEERYFGPAPRASFSHRTRLTAWNLSYSKSDTSFQEEILRLPPGNTAALLDAIFAARIPDLAARRAAVEQFFRASGTPASLTSSLAFYTQQVYIREGVEGSFAILGVRNSITFTAYRTHSNQISQDPTGAIPDVFLLADDITQYGASVRVDHKLTPLTSVGVNASRNFAREEQPLTRETRNDYATVTINHVVNPKTVAFGGVSVTRFASDGRVMPSQNADSVFVGATHRF